MHIKREIYIQCGELLQLIQCIDVFILHTELEIMATIRFKILNIIKTSYIYTKQQ